MMKKLRWLILSSLMVFTLVACPTAPDTTPPTISITTPSDNSSVTTTSVTITGTASDDVAISSLEYTLNGGAAQPVALANPFTVAVSNLVIGKNVVFVTAKDASGNTNKATLNVQYTFGNTPTISGQIVNWNTAPVSTGKIQFETSSRDILGSGNVDTLGNFTATLSIPPASSLTTYAPGAMPACATGSTATFSNAFKAPGEGTLVYNQNGVQIGFAILGNSATLSFLPIANVPVGTKSAQLFYVDTNVTLKGTCINDSANPANPPSKTIYNLNLTVGWNFIIGTQTSAIERTGMTGTPSDLQWYFSLLTRILKISKTGTGTGTISSNPTNIDCGTNCSASFNQGTIVTLTATPTPGSRFTGWSGDCIGTAPCTVTMDTAKSVTATFEANSLNITKAGAGTGTISSNPSGIDCGSSCTANFDTGTPVTLTATPASNSSFAGWSGACTGNTSCTLTMDAAKNVTATFTTNSGSTALGDTPTISGKIVNWNTAPVKIASLRFEASGASPVVVGSGNIDSQGNFSVVLSVPPTASMTMQASGAVTGCASGSTATFSNAFKSSITIPSAFNQVNTKIGSVFFSNFATFPNGIYNNIPVGAKLTLLLYTDSKVTITGTCINLTTNPASQVVYNASLLPGWNFLTFTQTTATEQTLTSDTLSSDLQWYYFPLPVTLYINKVGNGTGTVSSNPSGINCGATCGISFSQGTTVTLTATPAAGSSFTGWSGGVCTGTGTCVVTMDTSKNVTATFTLNPI